MTETIASGHNYSIGKDRGHYKFTLGNMTDAGWYWDGGQDQELGFLIRVANSNFTDQFVKDVEGQISFDELKPILERNIKHNEGLYEVSGDNTVWHVGEGYDEEIDEGSEIEHYQSEGFSKEDAEEIVNQKTMAIDLNYDKFARQYAKQYREQMEAIVKGSNSFEEFFNKINNEDFETDWIENVHEFLSDQYYRAPYKLEKKGMAEA